MLHRIVYRLGDQVNHNSPEQKQAKSSLTNSEEEGRSRVRENMTSRKTPDNVKEMNQIDQ